MTEIFHQGELDIQQKTGEALIANSVSRMITEIIPARVDKFIEEQTMAIVSSIDLSDNIWISVLFGNIGFTSVLNPNTILFNRANICSTKSDIFYNNIEKRKEFGSLFIELSTRRRFRINGVAEINKATIKILIQEAYANCPKYIQQRVLNIPIHFQPVNTILEKGITINQSTKDWIMQADTFFIGSKSNNNKLDASHRGGNKGFIQIVENVLKIPDYKGNSMYNTLGNIHQNSKTGILFIDFKKGDILQLTGTSSILFDQKSEEDLLRTGGTGRYLLFTTEQWIRTEKHHQVDWKFLSNSPFNPSDGES
jgi:hypothetical protein